MSRECKVYINGEWVGALDGAAYDDMDPYTGEVFARVPSAKRADTKRAIDAATAAFPVWSHTLPAERQALFLKAADILEKKQMEIVTILAEEPGCTFGFAMFQEREEREGDVGEILTFLDISIQASILTPQLNHLRTGPPLLPRRTGPQPNHLRTGIEP